MQKPVFQEFETSYGFRFENGFVYEIPKDKCKTPRQYEEWIAHLAEKNWWSSELEAQLISTYKINGQSSD